MKSTLVHKILGRIRNVSGRTCNRSKESYLYLGEFYEYTKNIQNVFEHVQQYERFTGHQARGTLESICNLLANVNQEVYGCQVGPDYHFTPVDKHTTEVGVSFGTKPNAVYLGDKSFATIDGLRSEPQKIGYLGAGKFSEYIGDLKSAIIRWPHSKAQCPQYLKAQTFLAYLEDIARVIDYLTKKPQHYRIANGEAMLDTHTLKTIKEIKEKLGYVSSQFKAWQEAKTDTLLTQIPLEGKYVPMLRLLVN